MAKPSPIDGLDADTPLGEAARRALAVRLHDVRAAEERMAISRDADALHDLRVATRRLRAALKIFGGPEMAEHEEEVKLLTRALGHARDLDVQLAWLDEAQAERRAEERPGLKTLADELGRARADREPALDEALDRWREQAEPKLTEALGTVDAPGRFGGRALRRLIRRRLKKVSGLLDAVLDSPDAHTAHRARIAVKKLRYAAELLEPAHPDEIAPILEALQPLQETLGDLHDRDARLELVVRFVARAAPVDQPGALALLRENLGDRDRLVEELTAELRRWQSARLARALARPLK